MTTISVVMPIYNVENYVADAIKSVLAQSFSDFELLIIDDKSRDSSIEICRQFADERIRIIHHQNNLGLAAARNTGIRHARGDILAFIDSDDIWDPRKLELHLEHLTTHTEVGVSFSRSAFINADGSPNNCYQMPKLTSIDPGYLLCRNPIGNGSAPVIRREVFESIAQTVKHDNRTTTDFFNESLRQSEDIECWIRIALTTSWEIQGIPAALTYYRLNASGLSSNLVKQLNSWEQVIALTKEYAPEFVREWESRARAYQLRYLARQAIRINASDAALVFCLKALKTYPRILLDEPGKTFATLGAASLLNLLPQSLYARAELFAQMIIGRNQKTKIDRDLLIANHQ